MRFIDAAIVAVDKVVVRLLDNGVIIQSSEAFADFRLVILRVRRHGAFGRAALRRRGGSLGRFLTRFLHRRLSRLHLCLKRTLERGSIRLDSLGRFSLGVRVLDGVERELHDLRRRARRARRLDRPLHAREHGKRNRTSRDDALQRAALDLFAVFRALRRRARASRRPSRALRPLHRLFIHRARARAPPSVSTHPATLAPTTPRDRASSRPRARRPRGPIVSTYPIEASTMARHRAPIAPPFARARRRRAHLGRDRARRDRGLHRELVRERHRAWFSADDATRATPGARSVVHRARRHPPCFRDSQRFASSH